MYAITKKQLDYVEPLLDLSQKLDDSVRWRITTRIGDVLWTQPI